jgi:hypothetical protein
LSFLSGALAQTHKFCYSAVASSSVVLILPVRHHPFPLAIELSVNSSKGFIVLCGSLELSSRNIVSGAVRLCYALVYSLFLGFGLAIGAEIYEKMTGLSIFAPEDYECAQSHSNAPWFRKTPSHYWGEPFRSEQFVGVGDLPSIPNGTHVFAVPKLAESGSVVSEGTRGS